MFYIKISIVKIVIALKHKNNNINELYYTEFSA